MRLVTAACALLVAAVAGGIRVHAGRSDGGPSPSGPRYPVIVHRGASLAPPGSSKPVPLVLGFHAVGGSPADFEATSGLDAVADEHGFVVAYLSAPTPTKPAWKPDQMAQNLPYVISEVKQLIKTQNVDPRRVYATGFSAGATMAFALGCQMSSRLAGVAIMSGAMRLDAPPCKLDHPVSELLELGSRDAVPAAGNPVLLSAAAEQAKWRALNGCSAKSSSTTTGPVTQTVWSDCDDQAAVAYTVITGGNHQWPGAAQATGADRQWNAAEELWAFFTAHPGPTSLTSPGATPRAFTVRSTGGRRTIQATVKAGGAPVTATLTARARGAAARKARPVKVARGATGKLALRLPAGAAGGRYAVTVTVTDAYGRSTRASKAVAVPVR